MKSRDVAMFAIGYIACFAMLMLFPMAGLRLKSGEVWTHTYQLAADRETNDVKLNWLAGDVHRLVKEHRHEALVLSCSLNTQSRAD